MIRRAFAATTLLVLNVIAAAAPAPAAVVVEQPRPFGYVLGDILTQRILLEFEPAALPPLERAGLWFTRRASRINPAEDGRRWLVIEYQLINAPQILMTVNLPSVSLKPKAGSGELLVPEWPVSVAPLTPRTAFAKGGLQELRPDHPPPLLPTLPLRRRLDVWSVAFVLVVLSWVGWWTWRHLRASANQPFARALRMIRHEGEDGAAAWLAMHRAFDSTAGRTVQLSTLPALFERAPQLQSQRAAIEHFFAASSQRFFAGASTSQDETSVRALCIALRRIEKRHEP